MRKEEKSHREVVCMRKQSADLNRTKPKRLLAAMLAFVQVFLLLPTTFPMPAVAAGQVEYTRINPEVSVYNAYTGIDEKLYEREISAGSKFNAATKSALFNLSFDNNLVNSSASFDLDSKVLGLLRKKDNNLKTSMSATFHNYRHQHTWKSGLFGINKNTANVTTSCMMSNKYRVSGYTYIPSQFINSRDMAKDYERIQTGYESIYSYDSSLGNCMAYFAVSLQGTMYDGGNQSCRCQGDASVTKPVITYMDNVAPSIVSVSGIDNRILKAGDTVNLEVKFDEPIRFADDSAAHDDLYVYLRIDGISDDRYPKAMLKKLENDTLYFTYTVTSDMADTERTISAVDFSPLMKECDLVVVFENGNFKLSTSGLNNTSNIGYTRATSYITDIAGNGMRESNRMYSVTEAYIDTKAPSLTKISASANTNNAEVKEILGSSEADNSDIYLGAGDSVEYGLVFSEVLDIAEGDYDGLTAQTNLLDGEGNPVVLTSKTVSRAPTDDKAYGLGPSKGNVTYINLNRLMIAEGMTCTDSDGVIRIKSVSFDQTVYDLAENAMAATVSGIDSLNKQTFYVDTDRPEITTSLGQTEDGYAVVPYEDNSGFYFPFEIKDYLSGTNGLKGSFKWNIGEESIYGSRYYYAVTSSADVPSESEWKTGYKNITYSFIQVEGTQYLHIKQVDRETYELMGTSLSFTAADYAGNKTDSSAVFPIDVVWDNTYPVASLGEVTKELGGAGGTLTVNVNLTESTALQDAYYLWTDTDEEPALSDVNNAFAGVENETSVTVTITEDIASGEDFNKYLWVKVSDKNGNEMLYNLGRQRYNLGTIDYSVNKSDDYDTHLYFHFATDASDGFLIALHPVPDTANEYYACTEGGMTYNDTKWYKVSSDDRRNFTVLEKTERDTDYLKNYLLNDSSSVSSEYFGYRNGDYVFYIISGVKDAFTLDENGCVTQAGNSSYTVAEEDYTVRAITPIQDGQDFYQGRSVKTQDYIPKPDVPNGYYYYSTEPVLSTLAGLTFDIDLGEDISGWNYDAIDRDRSYIEVSAIRGERNYSVKYKLSGQRHQSITLPEDDYPTGVYSVTLVIYNKGKSTPYAANYTGIYVDSRKAPDVADFGIDYFHLLCSVANYDSDTNYKTGITEQKTYPQGDVIYMPTSNSENVGNQGSTDYHRMYAVGSLSYGDTGISGMSNFRYNTNLLFWNVTAGQTEELAAINRTPSNYMNIELFDDETSAKAYVSGLDTSDPANDGDAPLALIKNTMNIIAVRAALSNGEKSEIKYYSIYPSWMEMPENVSTQTAEDGSVLLEDSQLIYTPDEGQSMEGIKIYAAGVNEKKEMLPQADGTYKCDTDSGSSWNHFHAVNEYGSIYYFGEYSHTMRDNEAPVITYDSYSESDGNYQVKFKVEDLSLEYYRYDNPMKLKILFDEAYSERLGCENGQQASFELTTGEFDDYWDNITPEDDKEYLWEADDISSTGIYRVEIVKPKNDFETYMEVTVYGTLKYDPDETEGTPVSFSLTAEATDKFGYTGSAVFENISAENTKPYAVSENAEYRQVGSGYDRALMIPFSAPVQPVKSWIMPEPEGYKNEWSDAFPVTKDGKTEISFYDIFGTLYVQEIELVDVFGDYGLDLNISPETYTKEAVSVTAAMAEEDTERALMFWHYVDDGKIQAISDSSWNSLPTKSRTITRQQNEEIMVFVYDKEYSRDELYNQGYYDRADKLTIHIDNIINGAPEAQPRFYFEQYGQEYTEAELLENFPGGVETTGSVEVWYKTSRFVTPIDGTGEKVKFTYQSDSTSHLFKYVDDFGNEGSLQIDLASYGITFAQPPEPYSDESAPTLVVDIYAKLFDNYTAAGAFAKDTAAENIKQEFGNIGYVQGYSMKIGVTDYSAYKIVVLQSVPSSLTYSTAQSDTITGVSISGNTVTISKDIASDFVIAVVDNASGETAASVDNFSYVTVRRDDLAGWFDTTKPVSEQEIVQNGLYEKIAYIKITDKADNGTEIDPSTITVMNCVLEKETSGEYAGWYKRVFDANASQEIIFRDHVGNMGDKATVEISGIDSDPPTLTVTWTPPYIGSNGEMDNERHTDKTVNTSVYAHISANKALDVDSVILTHYTYNGMDWNELESGNIEDIPDCGASYTVNSEGIKVCFEQGGIGLRFSVPSPNGKISTAEAYLPAEIIDKTVPTIETETTEVKRDGFDTPYAVKFKMTPDEDVYCMNYGSSQKVYGESESLEVTITQNGTFSYVFADKAGNRAVASITVSDIDRKAPKLTFSPDPAELPTVNTDQKITVTTDEACTLKFDGRSYNLLENGSQEFSFSKNGVYTVIATDSAGNESIFNIPVGNIDKTPPEISFENSTIRIRQDSGEAELEEALRSGVTVWEPETQNVIDDWTYDSSDVDLSSVGIYKVTYTAKDSAQNVKTAVRYVSVYDKNNPGIYLDGQLIEPEGTAVIKAGEHAVKVDNIQEIAPGVLEPYTVKINKGILTIGQVKSKQTDVSIDSDGKFTIQPGFYTISVVTQSRKTFRAVLYVEK